jgi:PTH1 family peptidyl-tRNA hydrolase
MKLIVGLGNPGREYEHTRHNVGFEVLDVLAKELNAAFKLDKAFKGYISTVNVGEEKVILLKPTTFMNLSGESVIAVVNFYKVNIEDILIIYDDVALDLARLRLRESGSAGGHNGVKSLIAHLGTQAFKRVRVGISGTDKSLCSHVLGKFNKDEKPLMQISYHHASDAAKDFIKGLKFVDIMTKYNTPGVS